MSSQDRKAYTLEAAAEAVGLSSRYLRNCIRNNELIARKAGSKILIESKELDEWLQRLEAV